MEHVICDDCNQEVYAKHLSYTCTRRSSDVLLCMRWLFAFLLVKCMAMFKSMLDIFHFM